MRCPAAATKKVSPLKQGFPLPPLHTVPRARAHPHPQACPTFLPCPTDWRTGPSSGGGLDPAERERLEEAAAAAREDAARHRALLAAAKREAEARERAVDEAQLRHERLEAQVGTPTLLVGGVQANGTRCTRHVPKD